MQGGLISGNLSSSQSWEKNHVITSTPANKAFDKIQLPVDAGYKPQTTGYGCSASCHISLALSLPKRDWGGVPRWVSGAPPSVVRLGMEDEVEGLSSDEEAGSTSNA